MDISLITLFKVKVTTILNLTSSQVSQMLQEMEKTNHTAESSCRPRRKNPSSMQHIINQATVNLKQVIRRDRKVWWL